MAHFKINRGKETNLPEQLTDGLVYFCTDTGNLFVDYNESDMLVRKQLNASCANKLRYLDGNEYFEIDSSTLIGTIEKLSAYVDAEFIYYPNLSLAISDINNNNTENSVLDISTAKVKVSLSHTGKQVVMLLDDVTEESQIDINKSVDISLNGKRLLLIKPEALLNYGVDTECIILGDIKGSAIVKEYGSSSTSCSAIISSGTSLVVNGGSYTMSGANSSHAMFFKATGTNNEIELNNCVVNVISTAENSGETRAIQTQAAQTRINNSTLNVSSNGITHGVYGLGNIAISNSTISANTALGASNGIRLMGGTLNVKNATILADAPDCHTTSNSYSIGITTVASGTIICEDSIIYGTHSGISNNGKLYISGGTYTGYCHGGIYFAHGESGVAYINDAILRCGNYEGAYDYSNKTPEIYGCFYVGGGTGDNHNNITAYLDGCVIGDGGGNAFVVRGSSGEQNNTVNLSNCTIVDGAGLIRIDGGALKVNIGYGTNITVDMIDNPNCAEFTDELYRKLYEKQACDGADYDAIVRMNCHQDLSEYAKKTDIPTIPVQSVNGKTGAIVLNVSDVGADPSGTAEGKVLEHNYDGAAHADIREAINQLSSKNVDLSGYATEEWVRTGYQPKGDYLTSVPDGYAKTDDIPTKTSELTNDSAFLTEVPTGYATEEYVKNKIAEAELSSSDVDLSGYAEKSEIPTKTSQLTNDSGYITDVPVDSVNGKIGTVVLSASDVGALPDTYTPPNQTADQVGADPAGTAETKVTAHNADATAHNDLRVELKALSDRLNAFFDSDDMTLDELSEIVAYITNNKTLIESITTSKVSVSDIIDNLTTNVANKPLSAAQGVALKGLVDALSNSLSNYALSSEIPTKVSQLTNDSEFITCYTETDPTVPAWAKASTKPSYTAAEVGALPDTTVIPSTLSDLTEDSTHRLVTDTEKSNWNAKAEVSAIPTKVSELTNDSGYLTSVPVTSVNNKTGAVTLSASEVGADASGTASSLVSTHNTDTDAHEDIREALNDKLDSSKLSNAIDTALEQAKESGEFDGQDGVSPTVTVDVITGGHRITITDVNGSKMAEVIDGEDGYTPVKGTDYYTDADKAEFESYIVEELAKRGQLRPEFVNGEEECTDTTKLYVLPDGYVYAYMPVNIENDSNYENQLPLATDTDRLTVYDGDGYATGTKLSSSGSTGSTTTSLCATGFIPAVAGNVLKVKDIDHISGVAEYIIAYNSNNEKTGYVQINITSGGGNLGIWNGDETDASFELTLTEELFGSGFDAIRLSAVIDENTVIIIKESPNDGATTIEYQWKNTGHAFVPADYEDRIVSLETDVAALKNTVGNESNKTDGLLYIAPDGSDSNDGLTADTPKKTVKACVCAGAKRISAKRGTYAEQVSLANIDYLEIFPTDNDQEYSVDADWTPITFDLSDILEVGSLETYNSIKRIAYTNSANEQFDKVFTRQSQPGVIGTGYNATVWLMSSDEKTVCIKLKPVLTIAEVEAEANTFSWVDGYIYINADLTGAEKICVPTNWDSGFRIANAGKVVLREVEVRFSGAYNLWILNCPHFDLYKCSARYSSYASGIDIDNANGTLTACYATKNYDGFGISGYGHTTYIDCVSEFNTDDGVSHHNGSCGTFIGGRFEGNGKGGNAPAYGANVNIYGGIYKDNAQFGICYLYTSGKNPANGVVQGAVIVGNATGLSVDENCVVTLISPVFKDNTTEQNINGIVTEYK